MTNWELIVTAQGSRCWEESPLGGTYVSKVLNSLGSEGGNSIIVSSASTLMPENFGYPIKASPDNQGALCSALYAFDEIDLSQRLIVAPGDFELDVNVNGLIKEAFENSDVDAFAVTFSSKDSRLSYARVDALGKILEYCEKEPVSDIATTGIFGFKSAAVFFEAGKWVLANNIRYGGRFFVSSAVNYFIMSGKAVSNLHLGIDSSGFHKNWGGQ